MPLGPTYDNGTLDLTPISQVHNHVHSGSKYTIQTRHTNSWPQQKLPTIGFCTHTTALWLVEQGSILCTKFDCPVICQNFSLLIAAHDCETYS